MIKQILKRCGYEPTKPPQPLQCAKIVVTQSDLPDCTPINLQENSTMEINYDFTVTAVRRLNGDQCDIYLGKDLLGAIDLNGLATIEGRRSIKIEWVKKEAK